MDWLLRIGLLLGGYLLGSIPVGLIIAKRLRGIDIREHGSGNIGATNVYRVLGKGPGAVVFILDVLKGAIPAAIAAGVTGSEPWGIGAGVAAVIGHSLSPFLGFKGGKSVATGLGVLVGVAPLVAAIGFTTFLVVLALTRYVSVGSILASGSIPFLMYFFGHHPVTVGLVTLGCALIIFRHRSNVKRLLNGTESKFGQKAP